jgi:hypothetical protein
MHTATNIVMKLGKEFVLLALVCMWLGTKWIAQKLMGDTLKVVWAKVSTLG